MKSTALLLTLGLLLGVFSGLLCIMSFVLGHKYGENQCQLEAVAVGVAVNHPSGPKAQPTFRWLGGNSVSTADVDVERWFPTGNGYKDVLDTDSSQE